MLLEIFVALMISSIYVMFLVFYYELIKFILDGEEEKKEDYISW